MTTNESLSLFRSKLEPEIKLSLLRAQVFQCITTLRRLKNSQTLTARQKRFECVHIIGLNRQKIHAILLSNPTEIAEQQNSVGRKAVGTTISIKLVSG